MPIAIITYAERTMGSLVIVIFGLALFEVISSVDNAIINAHVLRTLPERFRKIFLFWGLLFAVFLVRGLLPFIIVWIANPTFGIGEVLSSAFTSNETIKHSFEASKPLLLLGGGMYLFLVFLHWLFVEAKKYAFWIEKFIHRQSVWFYAFASIGFTVVIYLAINRNPMLALAAAIGTTAFFITDGFKQNAESKEQSILHSNIGAWSKILYLEAIDASFSIDGVIGAFAFTTAVPLIIIGNGLGALVVRELTVRGLNVISKFAYLKNGAMYTIGLLGLLMVLESFGKEFPVWAAPVNTFIVLGFFLYLSYREMRTVKSQTVAPSPD